MLKLDLPYPADQVNDVQVYSYAEHLYQDVPSLLIIFYHFSLSIYDKIDEQLW